MGAVAMAADVRVVALEDVPPIELPNGSWSRMLVTDERVGGNRSSLGYSVFTPGTTLVPVRHEAEELAYVVAGAGELLVDGGAVPFREGDALFVPAGVWHAVSNPGERDVVMVFGFPHPDYPPTERRS